MANHRKPKRTTPNQNKETEPMEHVNENEIMIRLPIGTIPTDEDGKICVNVSSRIDIARTPRKVAVAMKRVTIGMDEAGVTLDNGTRVVKGPGAVIAVFERIADAIDALDE